MTLHLPDRADTMRFRYIVMTSPVTKMKHAFVPTADRRWVDHDVLRRWLDEHVGIEQNEWRFGASGVVFIRDETPAFVFRMRWS